MLKAKSAETCLNIGSVHITLVTSVYNTYIFFSFNGFGYQHGTHHSLEF